MAISPHICRQVLAASSPPPVWGSTCSEAHATIFPGEGAVNRQQPAPSFEPAAHDASAIRSVREYGVWAGDGKRRAPESSVERGEEVVIEEARLAARRVDDRFPPGFARVPIGLARLRRRVVRRPTEHGSTDLAVRELSIASSEPPAMPGAANSPVLQNAVPPESGACDSPAMVWPAVVSTTTSAPLSTAPAPNVTKAKTKQRPVVSVCQSGHARRGHSPDTPRGGPARPKGTVPAVALFRGHGGFPDESTGFVEPVALAHPAGRRCTHLTRGVLNSTKPDSIMMGARNQAANKPVPLFAPGRVSGGFDHVGRCKRIPSPHGTTDGTPVARRTETHP